MDRLDASVIRIRTLTDKRSAPETAVLNGPYMPLPHPHFAGKLKVMQYRTGDDGNTVFRASYPPMI
jgi:hypothetical protein